MSDAVKMPDTHDPTVILDRVLRAMAMLNVYIDSLDADGAEGRYVLWTVRDILDQVSNDIERIPVQEALP